MKKQTFEIRLVQNREKQTFVVYINSKSVYNFVYFGGNPDYEHDVRQLAKAATFDEILIHQRKGTVIASYDIF